MLAPHRQGSTKNNPFVWAPPGFQLAYDKVDSLYSCALLTIALCVQPSRSCARDFVRRNFTEISPYLQGLGLSLFSGRLFFHCEGAFDIRMSSFTAGDLCVDQDKVVVLKEDMTVEEGLHLLTEANILSAPICTSDGRWVGLVDHLDILFWAMKVSTAPIASKSDASSEDITKDTVGTVMARMHEFSFAQLGDDISNLSQLNPFRTVKRSAPLDDLLAIFGDGAHRVVVTDEEGTPIHILTQSRVLKHLNNYPDRLGGSRNKSLKELGLISPVVSCKRSELAVTAFRRMMQHRVSALAVTEEDGELVGNISSTDIKLMRQFQYDALLDSVEDYLKVSRPLGGSLVACTDVCTLADAVRQMVERHVHRVYVVDEAKKAIGIVTLSDVLRIVSAFH